MKFYLTHKYGQMGNRMIILSHMFAYCRERDIKLVVATFNEYLSGFDFNMHQDQIEFRDLNLIEKIIWKLTYRFPQIFEPFFQSINIRKSHDLVSKTFFLEQGQISGRKVFFEGWLYRSRNIDLYKKEIQQFFNPSPSIKQYLATFKTTWNIDEVVLLGVHARRNDYKTFENGKYYFSWSYYKELIEHLHGELKSRNKNYRIILFSDSINEIEFDKESLNVIIPDGDMYQDFFLMKECVYVIGPKSTFSMCSSFLGDGKLYHLDAQTFPLLSDFKDSSI